MLDPSADEIRRWGAAAVDGIAEYFGTIRTKRVYPQTTAGEIRAQLDRALPLEGVAFEQLLETFKEVATPLSRQNGHPRMFGYVQAPGNALAAFADLLASALNANLTAWRSAPAAVEIELLTIDWIKEILGYDPGAGGLFVSGGSMANFAALAVARQMKAPENFSRAGAQSTPRRMCLYASEETHHSIVKAATLLGIGSDNVRGVAVDENCKIRIDDLIARITADRDAGYLPFCVIANAGTANTGALGPFQKIREVANQFDLWMHVDASYGGFAILAPSARPLFEGMAEADSIALDPHKWLYLPVDCGCVLYRDPEAARATFAREADYIRVIGQEADAAFAFWEYGPELSRRFRALKVWMLLKGVGIRALGKAIEKDLACARHFQSLVQASDDFEMLTEVELSIFCFRHLPAHWKKELRKADEAVRVRINKELDAWNERLLVALQHDGSSYLSNASIGGRFGLRGCVMNFRTTLEDMEILMSDLRRVAALLPETS